MSWDTFVLAGKDGRPELMLCAAHGVEGGQPRWEAGSAILPELAAGHRWSVAGWYRSKTLTTSGLSRIRVERGYIGVGTVVFSRTRLTPTTARSDAGDLLSVCQQLAAVDHYAHDGHTSE